MVSLKIGTSTALEFISKPFRVLKTKITSSYFACECCTRSYVSNKENNKDKVNNYINKLHKLCREGFISMLYITLCKQSIKLNGNLNCLLFLSPTITISLQLLKN